ncbi:MAG: putative DDB1- and CUL4-associated factor 13 [Streblomastix strix]|uniref:Putative DDB1-and CUL4-associated factor 13 n=1 Tax=Streblomastix strix TaxID=222440 RepID=A0A5J4WVU7_9EUKA|nr:MAG: putative DDB1- and CUL4-associated factor 13 [Streblomastix strix]
MKIKAISRIKPKVNTIQRNLDPLIHPFAKAREAQRAVVAAKTDRIFAQPFVYAFSGHSDGVWSIQRHPKRLNCIFSGGCDGEIKVWNTANRCEIASIHAHNGFVRGMSLPGDGRTLITCSEDKTIKIWNSQPWVQSDRMDGSISALLYRMNEEQDRKNQGEVLGDGSEGLRSFGIGMNEEDEDEDALIDNEDDEDEEDDDEDDININENKNIDLLKINKRAMIMDEEDEDDKSNSDDEEDEDDDEDQKLKQSQVRQQSQSKLKVKKQQSSMNKDKKPIKQQQQHQLKQTNNFSSSQQSSSSSSLSSHANGIVDTPIETIVGSYAYTSVDHNWTNQTFCSTGASVDIWDLQHSKVPINSFAWGADTYYYARYNRVEQNILATCGSDRGIVLYDLRSETPIRKLILRMKTNQLCWNPVEPFNYLAGNEDGNVYEFDMRNLGASRCVYKDHLDSVMSLDISPTGREFCSGSYDRTIRLWDSQAAGIHTKSAAPIGRSKDVYHLKRMQRIFAVTYTGDGEYILSGSDDMNVRLWKSHPSQPLYRLLGREKQKIKYQGALLQKHKHMPEVKRIMMARHLPSNLYHQLNKRRIMEASSRRKAQNIVANSRRKEKIEPERVANIVTEEK